MWLLVCGWSNTVHGDPRSPTSSEETGQTTGTLAALFRRAQEASRKGGEQGQELRRSRLAG